MGISVTCSVCQRTFLDIDPSMLGQKARCSCGTVVLLLAETPPEEPELIEELELLDDHEDLVLAPIDRTSTQSTSSRLPTASPSGSPSPGRKNSQRSPSKDPPSVRPPKSTLSQQAHPEKAGTKAQTSVTEIPEVELKFPEVPNPVDNRARAKGENARRRSQVAPNQDRSGNSSPNRSKKHPQPKQQPSKPLMADSFADVDDILNGGTDSSPLAPRREATRPQSAVAGSNQDAHGSGPQPRPMAKSVRQDSSDTIEQNSPSNSRHFTSVVSLVGGSAGISFGVIALVTRQLPFADTPIGWLGEPMFGMYQAAYGSGTVEGIYKSLFLGLGWLLLAVALFTLIASIFFALRGTIRMIIGTGIFGWSRGLAAIVSVVGLFAIMAILLTQYAHHDHLQAELNRMDGGVVGLVQDLENVKIIREQYVVENQRFSFAMLFLAAMPGTLFIAAIVSLIFDRD